ncbi:MAG: hypothetical protein V3V18_12115, partial [Methylococcales bacterium]
MDTRVSTQQQIDSFMTGLERRNPGETEFQQAVREVISHVIPYIADKPTYQDMQILERLCEPDR